MVYEACIVSTSNLNLYHLHIIENIVYFHTYYYYTTSTVKKFDYFDISDLNHDRKTHVVIGS